MEVGVEMITSNNEECIALNNLVKILNTWLHEGLKHITIKKEVMMNVERLQKQVVEAIQSNLVEMTMFGSFIKNIKILMSHKPGVLVWNLTIMGSFIINLSKSKGDLLGTWVSASLEEINKNMYEYVLII